MKNLISIILLLAIQFCYANDGAYYASGNQLIPITDSDISVTKEVLSLKKETIIDEYGEAQSYIYVTVDYTFYNSGKDKSILVGFEAMSPGGDIEHFHNINGKHPYINDFTVMLNDNVLPFKVAFVNTKNYVVNNTIKQMPAKALKENIDNNYAPEYDYVYHFNAKFKKGENKLLHTYKFMASSSVDSELSFDYILTAANRWANNQIDDFTLNIDMGKDQYFRMRNTFFNNANEWQVTDGRAVDRTYMDNKVTYFVLNDGKISFKKKNFKPQGELFINKYHMLHLAEDDSFDAEYYTLPTNATHSADENSFKILRNLPFAKRGYVFKTKFIQDYYLSLPWYTPNPDYKPDINALSQEEQDWLEKVKANKWKTD